MYVFAHVGLALGAFYVIGRISSRKVSTIDIRLLVIGSMLPDIIDKPLAFIGAAAGRGYAHTVAFFLITMAAGVYYAKNELSYGVASHLLLDGMWLNPAVLFWPVAGKTVLTTQYDVAFYWNQLLENRYIQVTEVIGALILLGVIWHFSLYKREHLSVLLKTGRIWAQ
jgi:hypothetical protein